MVLLAFLLFLSNMLLLAPAVTELAFLLLTAFLLLLASLMILLSQF
jgi:hypothetical protein